ncbi:uncharacterized protein LOC135847783 isoform X2 [Planococcus citri]|uniref:uncharacterized protein LOC135847783 isoform X2 n=1 Tax=Planococcus citri TaxID=170843 RepID=UPI0031F885CC
MSSKGRKSRKISDDEEANTSGHYTRKKQKTGECAQDSTTKQPAVSCRKISDEEEANTLEHHKKQKTGECVQLSTEKQSAPNCSSTTVNNEENASQNSMLEIKPSKTSASSTKLTLTADLKSEPEETEEYKAARLKNLLHGCWRMQKIFSVFFVRKK